MERLLEKRIRLKKRIVRVRNKIRAKNSHMRLVFNRTNNYLSAQLIDDAKGLTVCAVTTSAKEFTGNKKNKETIVVEADTVIEPRTMVVHPQHTLEHNPVTPHSTRQIFCDA